MKDFIYETDYAINDFIKDHLRCEALSKIFKFFSPLSAIIIILTILTVLLLCFKKTRKAGFCAIVSFLLAFIFTNLLLKNIIARPRPYVYDPEKLKFLLVSPEIDNSFPSGHTSFAFSFASALFMNRKKEGIIAFVFASIVAYSRLYVYVHYPSDVLCGALLGISYGIISYYLVGFILKKISEYNEMKNSLK